MPRILAIDYGTRRIGFAISDENGQFAFPLKMVEVDSDIHALEAVRSMAAAYTPALRHLLVGLPMSHSGKATPMAAAVRQFAAQLEQAGFTVVLFDERFSSAIAERALLAADVSRRRRKALRDKMAAQIFLQDYLDSAAGRPVQAPLNAESPS